MKKSIAIGIISLFIIGTIGHMAVGFDTGEYQPKEKSLLHFGNTFYVGGSGPGNFSTIQEAIDHAYDGDTIFVYNGTYKEHIIIDKQINLVGENRNNTIIHGQYEYNKDVVYIIANQASISRFSIKYSGELSTGLSCTDCSYNIISDCNFQYHQLRTIYLLRSSNNIIKNCSIQDSNRGILVSEEKSDYNTISGCYISTVKGALDLSSSHNKVINCILEEGLNIHGGSNNTIMNCKIYNNDGSFCIQMGYTSYNKLKNNTLKNGGIIFNVNFPYEYYHDIDTSNTIDGKPIYYILEESNREFNETMAIGYIGLISCTNVTVKNLSLHGIVLGNASFSRIENCSFHENLLGVDIGLSNNNIVSNCDFSTYYSVRIRKSSDNIVADCRMPIGFEYGYCVDINYYSSKNMISNCSIGNFSMGVIISGESHYNIVTDCIISNNYDIGIWLCASYNTIISNTIHNNGGVGILAYLSSSHNVSHNLIESNTEGIHCDGSSFNEISYNTIKGNNFGLSLSESTNNKITRNNFIKNKEKNARFAAEKLSNCKNTWDENYWNRPRFLPKLIIGRIGKYYSIPWINIDWHPILRPYNISKI